MSKGTISSISCKDIFDEMGERWPSPVVARTSLFDFTGGMIDPRYQANLDSRGEGPEAIRCGRKVAYPVRSYIQWLRARSAPCRKGDMTICSK